MVIAMPDVSLEIEQAVAGTGQNFRAILDGRRAVYLPDKGDLLVSDLHWGKGETFQLHGIPIPKTVLHSDLERLSGLIATYEPQRLLVLGDLIHGAIGLTDELNRTILDWRSENGLPILLIAGNHDRQVDTVAALWGIDVVPESLDETPFRFSHHPEETPGWFNWCGHIHPTIRLSGIADTIRLPCFHVHPLGCILPAFSAFTGGYNIRPKPNERVFALSDGLVIPV